VNPHKYFKSPYKILWILKEANDTEANEEGIIGDWDLRGLISKGITEYPKWKRTYLPIVYSVWGIFNDFCQWENMDDYDNANEMLDVLQNIAIINIKKMPGGAKSSDTVISKAYQMFKDILLQQIAVYEPEIIIFGGTIHHFMVDLGISSETIDENSFQIKNDQILIKNYHPNQRSIKQKEYCNRIINSVKEYHFKKHST
jgi:hypothetical protein